MEVGVQLMSVSGGECAAGEGESEWEHTHTH